MRALFASATLLIGGLAQAHESFAPHEHPHDVSWLPGTDMVGVAMLLLAAGAAAVFAYARSHRR